MIDLRPVPNRLLRPDTIDDDADSFFGKLPQWGDDLIAAIGQVNSLAAGGAYALPYVFDSATADADPGAGKLRLSSATQNAATALRLDVLSGGQDVSSTLDTFDASTSDAKGSLRLVKVGDPSKWLMFDVMARTAPSGYRNLTIVNKGGSSANPFANGDGLLLFFQRNGDVGTAFSAVARLTPSPIVVSQPVASLSLPSIFTAAYDRYQIEISYIKPVVSAVLALRLAVAGVPTTASNYSPLLNSGSYSTSNTTSMVIGVISQNYGGGFTIDVRNVNANRYKALSVRGAYVDSSGNANGFSSDGLFTNIVAVSGFELSFAGANVSEATINVYGYKNNT